MDRSVDWRGASGEDLRAERLYEFLSTYKLWHDIGTGFDYSNLGGGLLGHALARRAGMN